MKKTYYKFVNKKKQLLKNDFTTLININILFFQNFI